MVFTPTSLKSKRRKIWPVVMPPALLRSASVTCLNAVPEHAMSNSVGEARSILRVIENALNLHLPAPTPLLWLPMLSTCSISKLYSSTSNSCLFEAKPCRSGCASSSVLWLISTCNSASSGEPVYGTKAT